MANVPDMNLLENLRRVIGEHLADIAEVLDSNYKLTFIARFPGQHAKTIIVTDDTDVAMVAGELTASDDLLTIDPRG